MTLLDFGLEVTKIREAVNSLEVKGETNASLIVYTIQKCNDLISAKQPPMVTRFAVPFMTLLKSVMTTLRMP